MTYFKLKGTEVPNDIQDLPTEVAGSLGQREHSLDIEENVEYNVYEAEDEDDDEQVYILH